MLNDIEIKNYIKNNLLISENYNEECLTPNGYDLRIGEITNENIKKNTLFFTSSLEKLNLPDNIVASLYIKSKYSRKGIFSSFGFIDSGYKGNLTMTFYNFGDNIILKKGYKFVQIVFYEINIPEKNYEKRSGHYNNSNGINLG